MQGPFWHSSRRAGGCGRDRQAARPDSRPQLGRDGFPAFTKTHGVDGGSFFEKRCPGHRPAWLSTIPLDADSDTQACSIEDLPGLVWTANLAALELHTPQAQAGDPWHPTAMVFDVSPGAKVMVPELVR